MVAFEATLDDKFLERARCLAKRITVDLAGLSPHGLPWEHYDVEWKVLFTSGSLLLIPYAIPAVDPLSNPPRSPTSPTTKRATRTTCSGRGDTCPATWRSGASC